jgi:TetR/AcrR family transcriptional regulator, transcriptional repressor for nem operon
MALRRSAPNPGSSPTATRILDTAERMVQVRGFNAFSYADIATALGIRKASLHHHFATKADLGVALVQRYRRLFLAALDDIYAGTEQGVTRLERYSALYRSVLVRKRMCLCGMLATDAATLPRPMREGVSGFFVENERWLTGVLEEGRRRGDLKFEGPAPSLATLVVSSLEGAMLVARGAGAGSFDQVSARLIAMVRPGRRSARSRPGPAAARRRS